MFKLVILSVQVIRSPAQKNKLSAVESRGYSSAHRIWNFSKCNGEKFVILWVVGVNYVSFKAGTFLCVCVCVEKSDEGLSSLP